MTGKDRRTQIKKEGEVNIQSDIMFFIIKKKSHGFRETTLPFYTK